MAASRTVYEFLAEAAVSKPVAGGPTYMEGAVGPYTNLYYECARLVALFTIADLRHDFGYELNAMSGGETLGILLCKNICAAFYTKDNAGYNKLLVEISKIYTENITSDTTAKSVMKKEFNDFYDRVITPNRAIWGTYYAARYDDSGSEPLLYSDLVKANATHKKITGNSGKDTVVVVDALYGNPVDHIFSMHKSTDQSYYIYNYASALDAASKPIGTVHNYMHTYIQKVIPPHIIPSAYTGFGSTVTINEFKYEQVSPGHANSTWKTGVTVGSGPGVITGVFSPYQEASVDNLALVPVRGGAKKEEIEAALLAKNNKFNVGQTIANHIFKSLGDRLQTFTMMVATLVNYTKNGDLRQNNDLGGPELNFHGKHLIQFTNDILECMNNYLMQKNTAFTGLQKVIYYEYIPREPLTRVKVLAFFSERGASIRQMLSNIASKNIVNIHSGNSILNSIYGACTAREAANYCTRHPLFSNFVGKVPTAAQLGAVITDANFQSFVPLMADNIEASIIEKNYPIEITEEEVDREIGTMKWNMTIIDSEIQTNQGMFSSHDSKYNLYARYLAEVTSLENNLTMQGITQNTELLANCILYLLNNRFINTLIFDDLTKVYTTLINIDTSHTGRRLPFIILLSTFQEPLRSTLMGMYLAISNRINETPIKSLEAANELLVWIDGAMRKYPGIEIDVKVASANHVASKFYKMAVYIKLINTLRANLKPLIAAILATNNLGAADVPEKKASAKKSKPTIRPLGVSKSIKPTIRPVSAAKSIRPITASKSTKLGKSVKDRILIKIKAAVIDGKAHYTALQQSDAITIIANGLTRQRGGSRSSAKQTIEDLCIKKLEFMFDVINHPNNTYALGTILYLTNILALIVEDYNTLKTSKSKPHLLQTSVVRQLTPILEEDEELEGQTGGTRQSGRSVGSQLILVQSRGAAPAASVEWVPQQPGSKIMVARSVTRRLSPKFPGTGRRLGASPVRAASPVKGASPVKVISRKEGLSRIEKQLVAFFWLGVNRHPEQLKLEQGVYNELLPIDGIAAIGNIINQVFWQPFFLYNKSSYESVMQLFESKYLPSLKQSMSAPKISKRSSTRRTRKASSA